MTPFVPIILVCLMTNPTMCRPMMGYVVMTEAECMDSLAEGIDQVIENPDIYVAGLSCVSANFLDEQVNNQ